MNELDLFTEALNRIDPADRAAFLDQACAGNPELRRRLEDLLAAHERTGNPLDRIPVSPENSETTLPESVTRVASSEGVGTVIAGRYELVKLIGEGGMGTVYLASQTEPVKRQVALKLIRSGMDSRSVLARFDAERQALAMMDHPNIARIYDGGLTPLGQPFFVMELVSGLRLTDYCDEKRLTVAARLELFVEVCHAVQHAHQKGIIHRDLKPNNILVTEVDGRPTAKVIDFGVATATEQNLTDMPFSDDLTIVGTLAYISPEQADPLSKDIDTRTDVYSLGVILYQLLVGSLPSDAKDFRRPGFRELLPASREVDPPSPSTRLSTALAPAYIAARRSIEPSRLAKLLKSELDWVVMKALKNDRTRRYQTVNGFARDIQRFLANEVVEARPPSHGYRLRKFVKRNKIQAIAASLVLFVLLAGVMGTSLGLREANRATLAERAAKELADKKRQEAERNLAFAKKGNEILGSVFASLEPKQIAESGRPVQDVLRENLVKAVKELEGSAIGDPLDVAAMQLTLGNSLRGLGEYDLAVQVFEKAVATREAKLGLDHPDTLTSTNHLASGYWSAGKLDKAVPLFEQILALRKARFGLDDPDTLGTMNDLAEGYSSSGRVDKALPLLEETLALRKARLGLDHPDTLTSMNNLAFDYSSAGKLDKALPLAQDTLALMKKRHGPDHPDTIMAMNNLALVYRNARQKDKGLALLEETLLLAKAKLGPDHPKTLASMSNLAEEYRITGRPDKALPLAEESVVLMKGKLGLEHRNTLAAMNNLATTYWSMKRLDKSIPLFEEVLKLQEKRLGRDHSDALQTAANLGVNYKDAGRLAEAIPLLEEAYQAKNKHPTLRGLAKPLLEAYAATGEHHKTVGVLQERLIEARKALPGDSPTIATLLAQIGTGLVRQKKWNEAEPIFRECLTIREKTQPDLWSTFNTQSMLGDALLGQKRYAEAESNLLKSYEGMKHREGTIPPQGSARIPEALDRLVEFYTATNKPDDLKKWQAERAKYPAGAPAMGEKK